MFDLLALDWGVKYTGVAFADSESKLAIPSQKPTLTADLLTEIVQILSQKPIKTIILGFPSNVLGGETKISQQIKEFETKLQKSFPEIKIEKMDERWTTKMAKTKLPVNFSKHQLDNQAALEILNLWLNKNSNKAPS